MNSGTWTRQRTALRRFGAQWVPNLGTKRHKIPCQACKCLILLDARPLSFLACRLQYPSTRKARSRAIVARSREKGATVTITVEDALSRGLHAGDYANAYTSENLETAWEEETESEEVEADILPARPDIRTAYRAAFVIGFFGSYETHEVSDDDERQELLEAIHDFGAQIRALGLVCDERPEEEEHA